MYRGLLVQGNRIHSPYSVHRLMFVFWYLFCIIISALYNGTLVGHFFLPSYEKTVDSLWDLETAVKHDQKVLGTLQHSSLELAFKEADEGIYYTVYKLFCHDDRSRCFVRSTRLGTEKILREPEAIQVQSEMNAVYLVKLFGSRLFHIGRDSFHPNPNGFACSSGAPYKYVVDKIIYRMIETGLIQKFIKIEMDSVHEPRVPEDLPQKPLVLEHMQAAFYILLIGFILATLIFIVEMSMHRTKD
ncbi:unnamed protein product [Meganyctiphanes norvegica]|uniref:Ionotropic glutamate receptor C-terminal domain-containing protein n=1 Tax=Meganyctiphanes norvegica TaxID=48144 RepID=A0AAV2QDZ5_MEGNR